METAEHDRHMICEIGRLFWGDSKQCYSADAVHRQVVALLGPDHTSNPKKVLRGIHGDLIGTQEQAKKTDLDMAIEVIAALYEKVEAQENHSHSIN
ncbi:hypothetical protein LCGC14_1707890 [marine sediment metagenome]|uniref:Uncharacterized protein n=1 Tax=marine sediment metagenome TaxID=412755 RepID=A0A0F9JWH2_9ZZZZ